MKINENKSKAILFSSLSNKKFKFNKSQFWQGCAKNKLSCICCWISEFIKILWKKFDSICHLIGNLEICVTVYCSAYTMNYRSLPRERAEGQVGSIITKGQLLGLMSVFTILMGWWFVGCIQICQNLSNCTFYVQFIACQLWLNKYANRVHKYEKKLPKYFPCITIWNGNPCMHYV